jgi:peptide/nickel transport system permease protein
VALGLLAAWHRGRPLDWTAIGIAVGLESIPGFWLAMILVAVGGVQLGWFPTFGARDVFTELSGHAYLLDVARHLVLPAMALTLVTLPATVLTTRATLVGELGADYVRAARARGLPESRVLWRHAAANARLPVAAAFFVNLGQVIAGATVVETVFSYPGVGRLLYEAVLARDYAVLEGGFLLVTVSVVLANVVMDLLAPALDPRARPAGGS